MKEIGVSAGGGGSCSRSKIGVSDTLSRIGAAMHGVMFSLESRSTHCCARSRLRVEQQPGPPRLQPLLHLLPIRAPAHHARASSDPPAAQAPHTPHALEAPRSPLEPIPQAGM